MVAPKLLLGLAEATVGAKCRRGMSIGANDAVGGHCQWVSAITNTLSVVLSCSV